MVSLLQLKRAEITHSADQLIADIGDWVRRTESVADNGLEHLQTHHTQVRRLASQLQSLVKAVRPASNVNLATLGEAQSSLVEAQRVWGFFRSKLAQRDSVWPRETLQVADEIAWACYRPARDAAVAAKRVELAAVKEPPLSYLLDEGTPIARPRGTHFVPQGLSSNAAEDLRFVRLLLKLPVPIVGLPWLQVRHAPGLAVVAHEVGHAVEEDFQLKPELEAIVAQAVDASRREAWLAWTREAFADVFGTVALGPGFPVALFGYLADTDSRLAREAPNAATGWGDYPTRTLRILLCVATLEALGLNAAADAMRSAWPTTHAMTDYANDLKPLAKALVTTALEGLGHQALCSILPTKIALPPTDLGSVIEQATGFNDGLVLPTGNSPRQLAAIVATAWWLDPKAYAARDSGTPVMGLVASALPPELRGPEDEYTPEGLDAADRAAGQALERLLHPLTLKGSPLSITVETLFTNLKTRMPKLPGTPETWVVEGDLLLTEEELFAYAVRYVKEHEEAPEGDPPRRLTAESRVGGRVIRWERDHVLTYCVIKHTFSKTEDYELVVENMKLATAEWYAACGMKFEHKAELDETPAPELRPEGVVFPVYQQKLSSAVAVAFFPHWDPARRNVRFDPSYFTMPTVAKGGYDKLGVVRHELGHVLGFRHEQLRKDAPPVCQGFEDVFGFQTFDVTKYDPKSVMHYFCAHKKNIGTRTMELSELDKSGAKEFYEQPDEDCELHT